MRRKVKTLINSYKTYDKLVWGDGGIYDSLAGEDLNDITNEEYKIIDECYSNIISIMNGVRSPSRNTIEKHLGKYDTDDLFSLIRKHNNGNK